MVDPQLDNPQLDSWLNVVQNLLERRGISELWQDFQANNPITFAKGTEHEMTVNNPHALHREGITPQQAISFYKAESSPELMNERLQDAKEIDYEVPASQARDGVAAKQAPQPAGPQASQPAQSSPGQSFDAPYHAGLDEKYAAQNKAFRDGGVGYEDGIFILDGDGKEQFYVAGDDFTNLAHSVGDRAAAILKSGDIGNPEYQKFAEQAARWHETQGSAVGNNDYGYEKFDPETIKQKQELEEKLQRDPYYVDLKPLKPYSNLEGVNQGQDSRANQIMDGMKAQAALAAPDQELDKLTLTMMHNEQNNIGEANEFSRRNFKSFEETRDEFHRLNQSGELQDHLGLDDKKFKKLFTDNPKELSASDLMNKAVIGHINGEMKIKFEKPQGKFTQQEKDGYLGNLREDAAKIANPGSDKEGKPAPNSERQKETLGLDEKALAQVQDVARQFQLGATTLIGNAAGDLNLTAQGPSVQQENVIDGLKNNVLDVVNTNTHGQLDTTGMPVQQNAADAAMRM